ncbi:MAG: hypothetical protein IPP11_00250 [Chitinophagaceae bacterium]|nr:hypothetical protein [Chitinophagaceae bacterium]MBK7734596.1 hypothetical protein [Chitinophagaceae bacterium]MBK8773888.1 hypothetical protein [Chitinophagaceae bacterium]MBK9957025.1 hypothetical protein [Chitinophagaceae bacterium]
MKQFTIKIKTAIFFILVFSLGFTVKVMAQGKSPVKTTIEVVCDDVGNGVLSVSSKYNAQWWDMLKQMGATGASVIKNQFKKAFPKNELTDFEIKLDDLERTVSAKFKVLGMAEMNKKGKWFADLSTPENKEANITKVSDQQFLMIDDQSGQTMKIILPKSASDAKIEKDSFDKMLLTYNSPVPSGTFSSILRYLGFILIAASLWLFYKNFTAARQSATRITRPATQQQISDVNPIDITHNVKEVQKRRSDNDAS